MALTEKDAQYVAELAHLELTPEELKSFLPQLDSILQYMQALNELDTTKVEPMAQVTNPAAENPSLRPDQPVKTFGQEEALANAPERGTECFKVPRVIEREQ
jgi:aspartyl-tRNA(Asn)/glutamyl-tRNA(Gln) amidotransferase subunit C